MGKTALHHAVENGSTRVVKQLLCLKPVPVNVLAMDQHGHMPLYYALDTPKGDEESWTFVLAPLLLPKPANLSYAAYLSQPDHGYNFLVTMDLLAKANKLDSSLVHKAVQKLPSPSGSAAVQARSQAQPGAAQPGESLLQQARAPQRERMARAKARGGTAVLTVPSEQGIRSMATLLKEQQEYLQKLQTANRLPWTSFPQH
ncbi:hypothetical protein WJX82_010436 [Trebouxia sp. C0006]